MSKIVEITSYFSSKTKFKKSVSNVQCEKHQVLVDYLTQFAYNHSINGLYKTYLFITNDDKSTAYISFSLTTIEGNDAKKYLDLPMGLSYPIPALKITRLLTSDQYTNLGIASELLRFARIIGFILSVQIGCKAIVVDAKNDAVDFYKNNGYKILNREYDCTDTLFMIRKIETIKEYNEFLETVMQQFIEFCDDYSLDIFKIILKTYR